MEVVAIIPMRSGSKGIPNKNLIPIAGKPLFEYSLNCCLKTRVIDLVVISTDYEPDIFDDYVNENKGRLIIVPRDENAATDTATSEDALLDCLSKIQHFDVTCFVQCTSPLTEPDDLRNLIGTVAFGGKDSATFFVEDYGHFFDFHNLKNSVRMPRQKRKPLKREVGNAWCFKTDGFLRAKSRLFGDVGYIKIEEPKSLEIDNYHDIITASALIIEKRFRNSRGGIIYVDIDQTLFCSKIPTYEVKFVNQRMIDTINELYKTNFIILWTSRGTITKIDWREHTERQLKELGIKYHELRLRKPMYNFWVDDKSVVV